MAMEKLILRSVMYGVDKIPDAWFEKVPGGFYKSSQKANEKIHEKTDGGDGGKKSRRYSNNNDDRRRGRRDRYEDDYRSDDNRRQERRGRSSYDGSHDDDPTGADQRGARGGGRRRRRHSVDSDRYGYNDGNSSAPNNAYYGDRKQYSGKQPRPPDPYFDERSRPVTADSSRSANAHAFPARAATMGPGFGEGAAAGSEAPYPQARPVSMHSANMPSPQVKPAQGQSSSRPASGSAPNGYVPYAHIYGQSDTRPQPTFAPPPTGPTNQSSPTTAQGYQQNPFAQQAPTAADAGAGAYYTGQSTFTPQPSARAFAGYENQPPYPESPRPGRTTDKYSPSYASRDRGDSDIRRARSERRPETSDKGDRYRGKDSYVDPRAPMKGQANAPPPSSGQPSASKDTRRDSGHDGDRRSRRANDRGYTSD